MRLASQTVADVIRESRQSKLKSDLPKRLTERSQTNSRLNPDIYRGGFQPYRSSSFRQEPGYRLHDRLSNKSDTLESALGADRREIEQNYGFGNDSFESLVKDYYQNEGDELVQHLAAQGREFYDLTGVSSGNLGDNAVAGVAQYGDQAMLIGNEDFYEKVAAMANEYGVPMELAARYVLDHETVHLSQRGKYWGDELGIELDVENTLKDFYKSQAEKNPLRAREYQALEEIAGDRAMSVARNYAASLN